MRNKKERFDYEGGHNCSSTLYLLPIELLIATHQIVSFYSLGQHPSCEDARKGWEMNPKMMS